MTTDKQPNVVESQRVVLFLANAIDSGPPPLEPMEELPQFPNLAAVVAAAAGIIVALLAAGASMAAIVTIIGRLV